MSKTSSQFKASLVAGVCAFALCGALTFIAPAQAQVPNAATSSADPARAAQQFDDRTLNQNVSPRVKVKDLIVQNQPDNADQIFFTLNSLTLDGATVYSDAQIRALYGDKIGTRISLADLYGIAQGITNKYRNEGYILSQVVVPPQTIDDGNVNLRVLEGYIDQVRVEGNQPESAMILMRKYADSIATGKTLNAKDLERYLLLINDLPGVVARSVLSPSLTKSGAADLSIVVAREDYDALLGVDNFGSRFLGPVQLTAAGSLNSALGHNERISAQVVVAPDFPVTDPELSYISLGYQQPIFDNGTTFALNYSFTDTDPGYTLDAFDVLGRSSFWEAKIAHPFVRSRTKNLNGHLSFDYRDVDSKNNIQPTLKDRISAFRVGGDYQFLDTFFGVGVNRFNFEIGQGVGFFGASEEGDANLTRANGDPRFTKIELGAQRLQRLAPKINLQLTANGQVSSNPLLSSEEFGVGGVYGNGRGYSPSEIVGDDGVSGSAEIQWKPGTPISTYVEDYQLYTFVDGGRVWNQDATTSAQKVQSLSSTGVGIRADFANDVEGGLAVALPLSRDVGARGDRGPLVYFNLNKKF